MELSALKFVADTTELERASKVIAGLVTDVSRLDKVSKEVAQTEATLAKAAKANADANLQNAKAQDVRLKSTIAADKAYQSTEEAVKKSTEATERHTRAVKANADILAYQTDRAKFMAEGFSSGNASTLARAKALGQLSDELKNILDLQRSFQGNISFDKSDLGIKRMTKSLNEATASQKLFAEGTSLTIEQARELSRDQNRIAASMKFMGKSMDEITAAQKVYANEYNNVASAYNRIDAAEKAVIKQRKEVVSATNYLTQADQKMAAALNASNKGLDVAGTDLLVKYETSLRKSGVAQAAATQKLEIYKAQLQQVQALEQKRREQHLSRALMPQATDVVVSLWSGQSPLTVLLQQGGQVLDLFNQSGVAAEKFAESVKTSMKAMLPSIMTVVKGIGTLIVDGILGAGNAMVDFVGKTLHFNTVLEAMNRGLTSVGWGVSEKGIQRLTKGFSILAGGVIAGVVVALGALAVGFKQVVQEENALAKAMALSGATMGISHLTAIQYANSMEKVGVTTSRATGVITEMAKSGVFVASEIGMVTKAAVDLEKYAGIAIADTVKSFAKLKEKPVEAMIELAKSSGMVSEEVLKQIIQMQKVGDVSGAITLAMTTTADVNKQQVARMKEDYNGLAISLMELGRGIKDFFSGVFKTVFSANLPNTAIENELRVQAAKARALREKGFTPENNISLRLAEQQVRLLSERINKTVNLSTVEAKRREQSSAAAKAIEENEQLAAKYSDSITKAKQEIVKLEAKRTEWKEKGLLTDEREKTLAIAIAAENKKINDELNKNKDKKTESFFESSMKALRNNTVEAAVANDGLVESQVKLLQIIKDPAFTKMTEIQKIQVMQAGAAAIATEQQAEAVKQLEKAEEFRLKVLGKSEGVGKQYYSDMEALMKYAKTAGWTTEQVEEMTRALYMQTPAWKEHEKALESSRQALNKFNEESIAYQSGTSKTNEELDYRISLLGKTSEQQKILSIEYQREQKLRENAVVLGKKLRDIEEGITKAKRNGLSETELKKYEDAKVQAIQDSAERERAINRETAVVYAEDLQKEIDAIKSGISDSIVTALFEGGKEGSKKLRQVLVDTLRKKVTIVVDAVVNTLVGNVVGSLFGGSGGGSGGGGGSILGTISNGFSALTGGLSSSISNSFASFAMSSTGQSLGLSSMAADGMGPAALTNMGSSLGTAAGMLGSGLAGYGISSAISGGYTTGGNTVNVLSGIASAFLGPIAGIAGGIINRAFGRKLKDTGIQGTFGGKAGFEGEGYQFYKGGWLRSDKTKTSELDSGLQKMLSDSFKAMQVQVGTFATVLGLSTDKIAGFTTSMKVSLHGLKEEEIQGKIQEALATANNELAQQVIGTWTSTSEEITRQVQSTWAEIEGGAGAYRVVTETVEKSIYVASEYAKEGEKAIDTLARLAGSLNTVNNTFKNFGWSLNEVSLAGAAASSKFVDLFGTMENFTQAASTYYENFYTEAERAANVTRDITEALAKFGLETPKTREGYRALVEQQQKLGEAGAESVAVLLKLSGAFASIVDVANSATTKVQALANAEKERMKAARESANRLVEDQVKSFKSLQEGLKKEAFKKTGGNVYGFSVAISEVESSEKFVTVLDSATASLAELEKLNLGSEFEKYASEIGKVIQGTKELFANTLAVSRLAQGDVQGAIAAKMGANQLNYSKFTKNGSFNAGAFNSAYAKEQAIAAKALVDVANANALTTSNVASVIGQLNAFASSELILNEIKQGFIQGVREASNTTSTYVVRDAIQGLADVFARAEANRKFLNTSTGLPAIAAAYAAAADMQKVQMVDGARYMGEFSISYATAISNLNANFKRGKITATELEGAIKSLEDSFGNLQEYAVTPVDIAMSRIGASSSIATEGIKALNLYFGQLTDRAAELAEQAKIAAEPISVVTDVIGRMTSFTDVFSKSANAVINGFRGMVGAVDSVRTAIAQMQSEGIALTAEQTDILMADAFAMQSAGLQGLKESFTYGSQVRKALLISEAARIAGTTLTTADASKVAEKIQENPAFAKLTAAGIRDVSMLLDGLKQFDVSSFEKVFVRISEALNQGALNEEQYAALFDESINIFTDHDEKIKQVTDSFDSLRKAAESLADQLLIDAGYTSLSGSQTLEEAQRQYNEIMLRALGGDVTAASELNGITQQMLDIAKQQSQDESAYNRIFSATISDLRTVESLQTPKVLSEPIKVNAESNAELIEQIKLLREEIRASNAQIASNTDKTNKSLQEFRVNGMPTVALE
ncbi:MAG: phage tail length tape measure family protein [Chitinophagales bacterium]|nr:phage tail length tape measure family protein [Chitinophagales bacterium]